MSDAEISAFSVSVVERVGKCRRGSPYGPGSELLDKGSMGEDLDDQETPTQALPYPFTYRSSLASTAAKGDSHVNLALHRLRISSAPSSSTMNAASTHVHSTRPCLSRLHIPTSDTDVLRAIPAHPHPHSQHSRSHLHALLHPAFALIALPVRKQKTLADGLDMDFCCRGEEPPFSCSSISPITSEGTVSEPDLEPSLLSGSEYGSEDSDESSSTGSPVTPDDATPTATMFSKKAMLYA
jgi:hypothetical protein